MALPQTLDPSAPAGSAARSLGDDQIRALKQFLIDVLGLPNNLSITGAVFSIDTDGTISTISLAGTPIDPKYIDSDDITNSLATFWFKGSNPYLRLIGSETSAKDWRWVEDAGNIAFDENTGTEGTPVWSRRFVLASGGSAIEVYSSGIPQKLSFAPSAARVITYPDTTDTLVGRDTTDTLTNKTLTSPTINGATLTGTIIVPPASGVSQPVTHAIYSDSLAKSWGRITYSGGTPTLERGYNVSGIVDDGTGSVTIIYLNGFSAATRTAPIGAVRGVNTNVGIQLHSSTSLQASSVRFLATTLSTQAGVDPNDITFAVFGDQ